MSLNKNIKKKLERLDSVPLEFIDLVDEQGVKIFDDILKLLDTLILKDGFIVVNDFNISVIEQISVIMSNTLFDGEYLEGVKKFISEFSAQANLNNEIIGASFDFKDKDLFASIVRQSQLTTLQLLDNGAIDNAVMKPLKNLLSTTVLTGAKYSDVVKLIKENVVDDAKLTSYVKTYVYDAFAIFDRTYTQIVTEDLDVEYWSYEGGLLPTTRCWCLKRNGHVYTTEEIISWASGKHAGDCGYPWQGMNAATNEATIFSYLGGHKCNHSLIPVSADFVSASEINIYN